MRMIVLAGVLCVLSGISSTGPLYAQASNALDNVPQGAPATNAYKRFEWFFRQRALPADTIPLGTYAMEFEKSISRTDAPYQLDASGLSWSPVGPASINNTWPPQWGLVSGRVRAIAVHPTDPDIVYIGAADGGLWKTTNGGASWSNLSEAFAAVSFGAITIDPFDHQTVYAGTGEVMGGYTPFVFNGAGLYKSTDGGATWVNITHGFGVRTHFASIVVSPFNSQILVAALAGGYYQLGNPGNTGVWRSSNGGVHWSRVYSSSAAYDIVWHPTDSNRVFAAVETNGMYVSTNRGATWSLSNTGLGAGSIGRIQIALANSSPSTMYAAVYGAGTTRAYKSVNGGSSWTQVSAGVSLGGNYGGGWSDGGWWNLTIAADPTDADHVLIGNTEIHRTTNGSDFSVVRVAPASSAWNSPMHTDYHKIVFSPSDANSIYVGSDGGIFRSSDGGSAWSSRNNALSTIQLYRVASHPANPSILIGGAQDNGNFRTLNRGATSWDLITTGDGMEGFFDYAVPSNVYVSTQNGALYRSTSGGGWNSWTSITPGYPSSPSWLVPFFQHPSNDTWIYTASDRVWRSTNRGSAWTALTGALASDAINTMAQNRVNPNWMILAGSGLYTTTPSVMISSDGGSNWTDVKANIPGAQRYVSRVVTHPTDPMTFFVVRSGFGSGKVYRSTNAGATWTNVSGNLPDIPHSDLFIDPFYTDRYYVANDFGVYRSMDAGAGWTREGTGLPYAVATDFDFYSYQGTRILRVATHGRSVFEANLPIDFSVAPGSLAFGSVEIDSTGTGLLTLRNNGFTDLVIDSILSTHSTFSVVPPADTIPSGDSATFTVAFSPDSLGSRSGQIIFHHSMASSPDSVGCSGTGVVPLTVLKLWDMDDDTATSGDRVPKPWRLSLYRGTISGGNLIAQGSTGSITAMASVAGQYIACEADSGPRWRRINGGGALCDTFFLDQSAVIDTFLNYRKNSLLVRKYRDADSLLATTADAKPKLWDISIHVDSLNGPLFGTYHDSLFLVDDIPAGSYVVSESDSVGWVRLGHILNGTPVNDTDPNVSVTIAGGSADALHFVNRPPQYPLFYLGTSSLDFGDVQIGYQKADSVTVQNFGYVPLKIDSVRFDVPVFSAVADSMTIPDYDSAGLTLLFSPTSLGPVSGIVIVHHGGAGSPDTIAVAGLGTTTSQSVVLPGWNLISLPLSTQDSVVSVIYPGALTNAFTFSGGGYLSSTTVGKGRGYFLKVSGADTVSLTGSPLLSDTIDVEEGWNMIGSISDSLPVGAIVSDPGGLVTSSFYGFSGGYFNAVYIEPGRGYWVNLTQAGKLILSASAGMNPATRIRIEAASVEPPPPPGGTMEGTPLGNPTAYSLYQNHPNPFNPSTTIAFDLPGEGRVSLRIFTVMGQELATLVDGVRPAGRHEVRWDAGGLPSGVYYYRLQAGEYRETRKVLLLR